MDLGAVEAELLGDDDARQRHREVEVELALAPIDQTVDEGAGDVVDVGRHVGDAAREEGLRNEPAIVRVDGRVGALQGLDVAPSALTEDLLVAAGVVDLEPLLGAASAAAAREQVRVGEDIADVFVAGDHHGADLGHREHRALFVELLVEVPRVVLDHRVEHGVIDGTRECADPVLKGQLWHAEHCSRRPTPHSERTTRNPGTIATSDFITGSDLRHRWEYNSRFVG